MRTKHLAKIRNAGERGFSIVELIIVVAIILIVAAVAIPNGINAMRGIRLREATTNYAGMLQRARIKAVQNNSFYSVGTGVDPGSNLPIAFVDLNTPNSAAGGYVAGAGYPLTVLASDVTVQPVGAAPGTAALQGLFLPAGSALVPQDLSVTPYVLAMGNRGLPCTIVAGGYCSATLPGPVAMWAFLQSSSSGGWAAVTVTPAGRVQSWSYSTGAWQRF